MAASNVAEPQGDLPENPLEDLTMPEAFLLPEITSRTKQQGAKFLHMLEVYMEDFIQLSQTDDKEALRGCSRALLHRIHNVFLPPAISGHVGEEPVSMKKLMEGEGQWEVRKEILGWVFDGATRCIKPAEKNQMAILKEITAVLRIKSGVPFKRVKKLDGKLRHAAIYIPDGKLIFIPINQLLVIKPRNIFWNWCPEVRETFQDWRQIIRKTGT